MDPDDPRDLAMLWRMFVAATVAVGSTVTLAAGGVLLLI